MTNHPNRTIDRRVRRVARSVGLRVSKARGGRHCNNHGGYMLINDNNVCVHGSNYELSAEDVLFWCQPENREKLGHWWPEEKAAAWAAEWEKARANPDWYTSDGRFWGDVKLDELDDIIRKGAAAT
jgi:hypothetical protein